MAEYIEREGLMHELGPYEENDFCQEMSVILQIVAGRPASDVAPVVHGRWAKSDKFHGYVCCSICNNSYVSQDWLIDGKWGYCPNCGAKMDKEESEK